MKLKYYLRGLGIGIIVTTIILAISFSNRKAEISDEEVIARAKMLGMVMQEEAQDQTGGQTEATEDSEADQIADSEMEQTSDREADQTGTEQETMDGTAAGQEAADIADVQTEDGQPADPLTDQTNTTGADAQAGSYRLVIRKGDVCRVVCENLAANGVIDDAETFRKYLFEIGYASSMSVGEYDIPYGLTREEIAEILKAGPIGG